MAKGKLHPHLEGNWAPIPEETHAQGLSVSSGHLPVDLAGTFCRVGPNLQIPWEAKNYHMFAGDGMLHCVRIDGRTQQVSYSSRWIRTPKFLAERSVGRAVKPPFAGEDPDTKRGGLANTALVFHGGKLLALEEGHAPYGLALLPDGDVAMRGFEDFGGRLGHSFTAHPKVDQATGEMMFFGYNLERPPYCTYGVVDAAGHLTTSLAVFYDSPVMMHDCAITERHSIILYLPLVFKPRRGALPFVLEKKQKSWFAIFPRHANSGEEIVWFEYPEATYGYHTANSWEEGDTIHMVHVTDDKFSWAKNLIGGDVKLVRWSFHLPTRTVSRVTLLDRPVEFPIMNPCLVGHKSSFVYVLHFGEDARVPPEEAPRLGRYKAEHRAAGYLWAASKVNVQEGRECGRIVFGEDRLGTECSFVAKGGYDAEDAGYLVTILYDCAARSSSFVVYDAQTMAPEPLCTVTLPARVPFGFHALWVNKEQLLAQEGLGALSREAQREPLHRVLAPAARL